MPVKITLDENPTFPNVPVSVIVESSDTGLPVAYITLRHDELADLYLALTDFYASPDNTTYKENRP